MREIITTAAVALAAATAFAAGTVVVAVTLGVLAANLPAHPFALLFTVAAATVALRALPLLAVVAANATRRLVRRRE